MSPLAVGVVCTLLGGIFTLTGVAIGSKINAGNTLDLAAVEQRHREASDERQEMKDRLYGCERAINRLEATVAGMASIIRLLDPRLAASWPGRHDDH